MKRKTWLEELNRPVLTVVGRGYAEPLRRGASIRELRGRILALQKRESQLKRLLKLQARVDALEARAENTGQLRVIHRATARHFGKSSHQLASKRRSEDLTRPRFAAIFLQRELTGAGVTTIARYWRRDHGTICSALDRARALLQTDRCFSRAIDELRAQLSDTPTLRHLVTPSLRHSTSTPA